MNIRPLRALLSVSDKTGILEFANCLIDHKVEILSTGGTAKHLKENKVPVTDVSDHTGFPEIMGGRVKTLHPRIAGGILAHREDHAEEASEHDIPYIDIVVCNLYPFKKTIEKPGVTLEEAIENIDIGGPTMIRAAAKNYQFTSVIVDPNDYESAMEEISGKGISLDTRKRLCIKTFAHTAAYDAMIQNYLEGDVFSDSLQLSYHKKDDLRYGENPHQAAAVYSNDLPGIVQAAQLQGKPLSYNNYADGDSALQCVSEFDKPACVVVKHANPCGVAIDPNLDEAFNNAWNADSKSAFGGIVALNRRCTPYIAGFLKRVFFEVLIAPDFDDDALELLEEKENLRILKTPLIKQPEKLVKSISGGALIQEPDTHSIEDKVCVTEAKPTDEALAECEFAWRVTKHIKSNGILISKNKTTLGIGAGQVSRIDAVDIAIQKAGDDLHGAVLASDAFFPFRDSIDRIAETGIKTIIQPGGSMRDDEVIQACNEHGIAMIFTGNRCFRH